MQEACKQNFDIISYEKTMKTYFLSSEINFTF